MVTGRIAGRIRAPLLRLEELADGDDEDADAAAGAASAQADLDLPEVPDGHGADEQLIRHREHLRGLLLGYDMGPHGGKIIDEYVAARTAAAADGHRQIAAELELIEVFTDLADLTSNGPWTAIDIHRDDDGLAVHSAREYFHTYLRSLDVERAGLPESFRTTLDQRICPG